MIIIPIYKINNSWCFVEITIKFNDLYWIDFEPLIDSKKETFEYVINNKETKILCIIDNKYNYFNTDDKNVYSFNQNYRISSFDDTRTLDSLKNLKKMYSDVLLEVNYIS